MRSEAILETSICMRSSPFGQVAVVWSPHRSKPRVLRILLSRSGLPADRLAAAHYPAARGSSCREMDSLADDIAAFLHGEDIRFKLNLVRMDLCSEFQQRVLRTEHAIPRGRVSTYGRLARHLGIPTGPRAVGNCLATNPFPIVIPCHRAIRSDRTLGGYQGGVEMKLALLEMEGLRFDRSERVVVSDFFY
jgi:methylated-DNA-[protein]-cysteine S-methyltransferase